MVEPSWTSIWLVDKGDGTPPAVFAYRTEKLGFWAGLWNRIRGGDGTVTHFDIETRGENLNA